MSKEEELEKKIVELESQIQKKDQDLKVYQRELSAVNAHLEKLIVQANDQLRQSLKIQKFLVPTEFPNIPGFEFSTKFSSSPQSGGDYFDIFEHYDKMRFGLFLSSASGYGTSALFLSVLMKLTYQIEDSKKNGPLAVLQDIVSEMKKQESSNDVASIFYGVFDRRKLQMTYCNVGGGLGIHYQASTGQLHLLNASPQPISFQEDFTLGDITNSTVGLDPNDKLIFCSSGFLAQKNHEGDGWGLDALLSIVKQNIKKPVHELRNELFYQVLKFCGEQTQDLTVVVTEVKERIMKLA